MTITLNDIKEYKPCQSGWITLLRSLGKREADNDPLSLMHILESNGIKDAIWCLRCVKGEDKKIRLFAIACAREVQYLMCCKKSTEILDVAERFANNEATVKELVVVSNLLYETIDDNVINSADRASYNTAICSGYSDSSIGIFATYIADDAAIAAAMDGTCFRKKERDEALARQKELFIQFFGEENK